jgi:hypothetical protein
MMDLSLPNPIDYKIEDINEYGLLNNYGCIQDKVKISCSYDTATKTFTPIKNNSKNQKSKSLDETNYNLILKNSKPIASSARKLIKINKRLKKYIPDHQDEDELIFNME